MATRTQVSTAARLAQDSPPALAALVLDLLSRQAEGRALFASKELVRTRAEYHGVTTQALGDLDVVKLLGRGAETEQERTLIAALAVQGLRDELSDEARVSRFLKHADWLAVATEYPIYEVIAPVLGEDAEDVWLVMEAELRGDKTGLIKEPAKRTAVTALRRWVLTEYAERQTAPSGVPSSGAVEAIEGTLRAIPPSFDRSRGWYLFQLVTGIVLLRFIWRGLSWLLRSKRQGVLEVRDGKVWLHESRQLFGKPVGEESTLVSGEEVVESTLLQRRSRLLLTAGTLAFGLALFVGGVWLFEGVRSGETVLFAVGGAVIGLGAALDILFNRLWQRGEAGGALSFATKGGKAWLLEGVKPVRAKALFDSLN